jgi:chemotaxis signal transduction protein
MTPDATSPEHATLARPMLDARTLDERTASLAAALPADPGPRIALLRFRCGGERFALPARAVERVFGVQPVRRVPHRARPAFRGLVAHEGDLVLVGSLERLLELPETPTIEAHARMVLLGPPARGWAFAVDGVDGVAQVPETALRPAPSTVRRGLGTATRMLADIDGHATALLDSDALRTGWEGAAR